MPTNYVVILDSIRHGQAFRPLLTPVILPSKAQDLFETRERAQAVLNSIGDAVICIDLAGNVS